MRFQTRSMPASASRTCPASTSTASMRSPPTNTNPEEISASGLGTVKASGRMGSRTEVKMKSATTPTTSRVPISLTFCPMAVCGSSVMRPYARAPVSLSTTPVRCSVSCGARPASISSPNNSA